MVFAGLGALEAEGRDDLAGLDVTGRIVVVLGSSAREPSRDTRRGSRIVPFGAETAAIERKARHAAARGAAGLIVVSRDRQLRSFGSQWPTDRSVQRMQYRLPADELPIPVVRVGSEVGATILGLDRNHPVARDVAALYRDASLRFDVPGRLRLQVVIDATTETVHNVLGVLPGSEPGLRSQVVVIGAHLDHDGVDADGRIFNGADDDASGVAAVLEMAEAFAGTAEAGRGPRRTVLFALWNAEEKGLLGSRYYTKHVVPENHTVVANVTVDMIGRHEEIPNGNDPRFGGLPPRPASASRRVLHMIGYSLSPDLAGLASEEARAVGLTLEAKYDRHPLNLLRRSDHWPFLLMGVPSLFLTTGLHPDYHTPDDDVGRIDFGKLERVARLAFRVAWRVAEAPSVPHLTTAPTPEP
jgi:hypothetical protein